MTCILHFLKETKGYTLHWVRKGRVSELKIRSDVCVFHCTPRPIDYSSDRHARDMEEHVSTGLHYGVARKEVNGTFYFIESRSAHDRPDIVVKMIVRPEDELEVVSEDEFEVVSEDEEDYENDEEGEDEGDSDYCGYEEDHRSEEAHFDWE